MNCKNCGRETVNGVELCESCKCKKTANVSRYISIALALILTVCVLGSTVFAKQMSEMAEIFYNNIKIYIDGADIVPKDANGNTVEAFIMNGTTYLPVRAVSEAFGKEVEWDGATQSVYIGKKDKTKPDNYLDKIQYNDYKEQNSNSDMSIINGTVTDFNKNVYTNGIVFWNNSYGSYRVEDDADGAQLIVAYPLNSQYKKLNGKIVLPQKVNTTTVNNDNCETNPADVWIYGDGKLLYRAVNVTTSMPFTIDANVTGVNQLTVKLSTQNWNGYIALTDLALYK